MNKQDRWSALSMQERANFIKLLYKKHSISDLEEIRNIYNSFGDGGNTEQESNDKTTSSLKQTVRKVKAGVMDVLQKYQYEPLKEAIKDTLYGIQFGTGTKKDYVNNKYEDVAQDSFLFSRKEQKDAFLNSGYIEGTAGDYGLVAKAVGNRNLPVYQSSKDDITRDKLTVIGNLPSMFFGEGELVHAGYYPTALYKDTEGNIYQKAWDLQDYGPDSTGTGGYYSQYPTIKQLGSKILDMVGNPVVRTTGFQQISDDMLYNLMYQIKDSKLWSELMNTKASNAGNTVMEERVLEAYEDLLFMKAQELADKENREYSMEDYDYIKKTLPLEIFKSNITDYYDSKALSEIYSIFTNENKFATGGPIGEGTATYNHPKYNHKEEAAIYSYLRERGVPHTQTSAIMGNIAVESMLDPNISQIGGGGGYGLIQATDQPRKNNFINYDGQPYEFGSELEPETQRQLDYIIDKGLNNYTIGEWRKVGKSRARNVRKDFLKETDIIKASDLFTKGYLRPGKPHTKRRQSMSTFYNEKYTNPFENDYNNAFLFK